MEIGIIVNTHGVKGDVKVIPYTFEKTRFGLLDEVALMRGNDRRTLKIENVKYQKQFVILKFAGIDDMAAAAGLKNYVITIPKSLALPLGDDEYYIGDIIGCRVTDVSGETLGELTEIIETGANDVYAVTMKNGRELLIPAVKKYIKNVDTIAKTIVVDLPEELG